MPKKKSIKRTLRFIEFWSDSIEEDMNSIEQDVLQALISISHVAKEKNKELFIHEVSVAVESLTMILSEIQKTRSTIKTIRDAIKEIKA